MLIRKNISSLGPTFFNFSNMLGINRISESGTAEYKSGLCDHSQFVVFITAMVFMSPMY